MAVRIFLKVCFLITTLAEYGLDAVHTEEAAERAAGHERLSKLANHYEVVLINTEEHMMHVSRERGAAASPLSYNHPHRCSFLVQAFGKRFKLDLRLNTGLLPDSFELQYFKANGDMVVDKSRVHCYYHGDVAGAGEEGSEAVLSTCHGLSGWFAVRSDNGTWSDDRHFFIEPLMARAAANGSHLHAVFRGSDAKEKDSMGRRVLPSQNCGVPNDSSQHGQHLHQTDGSTTANRQQSQRRAATRVRRNTLRPTLYNELLLVMDHAFFRTTKSLEEARGLLMDIANNMDALYRKVNIRIPLVTIRIFNQGDLFTFQKNEKEATLDAFLKYWRDHVRPNAVAHDNAQFLTGVPISAFLIGGLATYQSICSERISGGITHFNKSHSTPISSVMKIINHEMGHNFGLPHVIGQCTCPESYCLMAPAVGNGWPALSTCSRNTLEMEYQRGSFHCLSNEPKVLASDVRCGNGFTEAGEDCDCGSVAECTNKCCNATTCRFVPGAVCSPGPCCFADCQHRSANTVCRRAVNTCDITERCSGDHRGCAQDYFAVSGKECGTASNPGRCHTGLCRTHNNQCSRVFGKGASSSTDACYQPGLIRNPLLARATTNKQDLKCDLLMCKVPFPKMGQSEIYLRGGVQCVYTLPSRDVAPQFYVDDFTTCADPSSVCSSRHCVNVSSLILTCPGSDSGGGVVCSGNGECAHPNVCYCNAGFGGAACNVKLSSASGQASGLSGGAVAGIIIGILLALLLVGVVYIHRDDVRRQLSARAAAVPSRPYRPSGVQRVCQDSTSPVPPRPSAPPDQNQCAGSPSQPPTRPPPPSAASLAHR